MCPNQEGGIFWPAAAKLSRYLQVVVPGAQQAPPGTPRRRETDLPPGLESTGMPSRRVNKFDVSYVIGR